MKLASVLALLVWSLATTTSAIADEHAQLGSTPTRTSFDSSRSRLRVVDSGVKAPADEYFGVLGMSILGVRNTIADIDARAEDASDNVARRLSRKLTYVEAALREWQSRYPGDPWIPQLGYALLHDYEKVDDDVIATESWEARTHIVDLAGWLEAVYPNSPFASK